MALPRFSFTTCQDLVKNLVNSFVASIHRKMYATNIFNILQGTFESLKEYLALFNEVAIKVIHPNQKMFVGAFQNGLKSIHFNEYLVQRLLASLDEVMTHPECYINDDDINVEKKARDVKTCIYNANDSQQQQINQYTLSGHYYK